MNMWVALLFGLGVSAVAQETFWLERPGEKAGPFSSRHGALVTVGSNTYQVVTGIPSGIFERMERVVIPEIDLKDATVLDAVKVLNDHLGKADSANGVQPLSVDLVLTARREGAIARTNAAREQAVELPRITFSARKISAFETVKILCGVCGLKYRVEGRRIVLMPLEIPETQLVVRTYDVGTNFLDRINGTSATARGGPAPWPVCFDVSGAFASDGKWKPLPATFCPTSGLLTRVMYEGEVPSMDGRFRRVGDRSAANAVQETKTPLQR